MRAWIACVFLTLLNAPFLHAEEVVYYHTDALGSVAAVTDANGNVIERTRYAPYGDTINRPLHDGPGYTGHETDANTGFVYMQQRYYDPVLGRFLSADPAAPDAANTGSNFNRYWYANDNPHKFTDPDGRNVTEFIGGAIVESWNAVNGNGFNGASVVGALKDGYNGEGGGVLSAALQDAATISIAAGGAGALKAAGSLARQTGEKIVSNLAKNAVKDDIKSSVRQIVKNGGEKQFRQDAASAMKGAKVKTYATDKGPVQVGTHADGTTVSTRTFSSSGRPTIQVEQPNASVTTKVRYEKDR